jgi:hypothetical protein
MTTLFLAATMVLAARASAAATGRVVDIAGAPIDHAEVCEFVQDSPGRCVKVDAAGEYRLENPVRPSLVVRARGYVATTVDAAPLAAPVALRRAATLRVYVFDKATGEPLSSGRVMIHSPSGRRIGDFVPFNRAGVRISTLEPGEVLVRAEASGYDPGGPLPVELFGGEERSLRIPMLKAGAKPR